MKQPTTKAPVKSILVRMTAVLPMIAILFLSSFTISKVKEDLFKKLGIVKTAADKKIADSFFGGYINTYGAENIKSILVGDRVAVTKDLLVYTKQYIASGAFAKEYQALREQYHPKMNKLESPEEMRASMISMYKKSVAETQENLKKANPSIKKVFEDVLADAKLQLQKAEDLNNKVLLNYTKNYENLIKTNQASYDYCMKVWETKYPENPSLFIKERLVRFMNETKDIDFSAAVTVKGNKKVFVDPQYEAKGYYWKMAYRAGKESVETARGFVQEWLNEIGG